MADYKKKRVGFKKKSKAKNVPKEHQLNVEEVSSNDIPDNKIKVVKGKKLEKIRRFKIFGGIVLVLAIAYIIMSLILPISIGENLTNWFAVMGSGEYPAEIYGAKTLNAVSKGSYYYVLTDTNLSAFSNGGKEIYTISHGYENPVLCTAATRAAIYDQNGNSLKIYNLKEETNSLTTQSNILAAAISRNGSYVVATDSDEYAATITVYNRKDKKIFEWNSAKDKVNAVAIDPDGEKIAVSTINASEGSLFSNIYVLNFEKGKEYSSKVYNGFVYGIYDVGNAFSVVSTEGYSNITWDNHEKKEYNSVLSLSMYRQSSDGVVLTFNRDNNTSDNDIVVFSNEGEKISEFSFKGNISDIQFYDDHIYCISDSKVYLFDNKGELLGEESCDYVASKIIPLGAHTMATISDSEIKKLEIKN